MKTAKTTLPLNEVVDLIRLMAAGDRAAVNRSLNQIDLRACRGSLLLAADLLELTPEGLAAKDAADVIVRAELPSVKEDLALYGHSCLVSGSMYAPSWRVLDGGRRVWEMDEDAAVDQGVAERYTEALDEILDAYRGPDDETIGWHEGDLFLNDRDADEVDGDRRD